MGDAKARVERTSERRRRGPHASARRFQQTRDAPPPEPPDWNQTFREILTEFRAPIFGYLVRAGLDRETCNDIFQEIFLRIHRAKDSFDRERPIKPWLFTIVANTVRTHFRKIRVRQIVESSPDKVDAAQATAPSSEEISSAHELGAWLEQRLLALPLAQREVVLLACIEELKLAEVATITGKPENTVKTLLRRARLSLADDFARRKKIEAREGAQ